MSLWVPESEDTSDLVRKDLEYAFWALVHPRFRLRRGADP